jgi:superfamily II DNA or RNA helicase
MQVTVGNIWSLITDCTDTEYQLARTICTVLSLRMAKRRYELHPQQYVMRTYYLRNKMLPTGLLPRLIANGLILHCKDARTRPRSKRRNIGIKIPKPTLRTADYSFQEAAVKTAIAKQRGLLWYPTGAGKTIIMAKIIHALGLRTLVVVPNNELLWQTYRKFQDYFGEKIVGAFGAGNKTDFSQTIIVGTQQSLHSLLKKDPEKFKACVGENFDVLFIDECHHVAATVKFKIIDGRRCKVVTGNSWYEVAQNIDCFYRFGVSATIEDIADGNNEYTLSAVTGRIVGRITTSELIACGVLCPLKVTMVKFSAAPCETWQSIYKKDADGNRVCISEGSYDVNILSPARHDLICCIARYLYDKGKHVLVLVDLVENHGQELQERMRVPSVFLHGTDKRRVRDAGIAEFIRDRKVLISTIVKEGFDVPTIDALIIAGGGRSHRALIQKIGRGRRVARYKHYTEVWDIYDDDGESKYGPRMCLSHSLEREKLYRSTPEDTVRLLSLDETNALIGLYRYVRVDRHGT